MQYNWQMIPIFWKCPECGISIWAEQVDQIPTIIGTHNCDTI
jgi:rubredoxin